jgi:hypothetical protein
VRTRRRCVKRPNIKLSSALSELGTSANESRRPRGPLKRPRRVPPPETVEGARIWCHRCHQDRTNETMIACTPCGKSYCYSCMARRCVVCNTFRRRSVASLGRYGENVTRDQHNNWTCPRCQNHCDCIKYIKICTICSTSSPSAQTLYAARGVSGGSRLMRACAKIRSAESTAFPETLHPAPELSTITRADREGQPADDVMYDFKAPSETPEMEAEEWSPADADNGSYEALAFQAGLRLTSNSTLVSTPTPSSALPGSPHPSATLRSLRFSRRRA